MFFCVDLILKTMVSLTWMVWSLHIFDGIDNGFLVIGIASGFILEEIVCMGLLWFDGTITIIDR